MLKGNSKLNRIRNPGIYVIIKSVFSPKAKTLLLETLVACAEVKWWLGQGWEVFNVYPLYHYIFVHVNILLTQKLSYCREEPLSWVRFPRKQTLTWGFAFGSFLWDAFGNITEKMKEAGLSRGRWAVMQFKQVSVNHKGKSGAGMALQSCSKLRPKIHQSLEVGCPWKGVQPRAMQIFWAKYSLWEETADHWSVNTQELRN